MRKNVRVGTTVLFRQPFAAARVGTVCHVHRTGISVRWWDEVECYYCYYGFDAVDSRFVEGMLAFEGVVPMRDLVVDARLG